MADVAATPVIIGSPVPAVGRGFSAVLSIITIVVVAICISRRMEPIRNWKRVSPARWLLLVVYMDSFAFVVFAAILDRGLGIDLSIHGCRGAQLLCLILYITTKVFIYLFLVEKAYIVRGMDKPRLKDRLYLINFFAMLCPYFGVFLLNFLYRFNYLDSRGLCWIGISRFAMVPTFTFEILVNVYLTLLFILPIRKLYSFRNKNTLNSPIRTVAVRTFIGSCATLSASVINISVLVALEKEPAWMCLMMCNADILFSVLVLHWVTSIDTHTKTPSRYDPANSRAVFEYGHGSDRTSGIGRSRSTQHGSHSCVGALDVANATLHDRHQELSDGLRPPMRIHISARRDEEDILENFALDTFVMKTTHVSHVQMESNSSEHAGGTGSISDQGDERLVFSGSSTDKIVGTS